MAIFVSMIIAAVVNTDHHTTSVRVQEPASLSVPVTTPPTHLPPISGMATITNGTRDVGYVPRALLQPTTIAAINAQNARTMLPVTLGDGTLVGYLALGLPFIPLEEAREPGFDVEAVRARANGGCEPQIGDPSFKQKYPLCPAPPPYEPPPGPIDTATTGR
jgi:hypothetical protein